MQLCSPFVHVDRVVEHDPSRVALRFGSPDQAMCGQGQGERPTANVHCRHRKTRQKMKPPVRVLVEKWRTCGHGIAVRLARHPTRKLATLDALPKVSSGGGGEPIARKEETVGGVRLL